MSNTKIAQQAAINAARIAKQPFETLKSQVAMPLVEEFGNELGAFFGSQRSIANKSHSLGQEELKRAREAKEVKISEAHDNETSEAKAQEVIGFMKQEYSNQKAKNSNEQTGLKQEVIALQEEIAKLAEVSGVDTKAHMQNTSGKIGIIDIKFFTKIVSFLRIKAEESKSARELQSHRQNSKRSTGMLAWVSGKQMQVHEQGTLTLQG